MSAPLKTCFVSMPLGTRHDAQTGASVDFDRVYRELVAPAVEAAGLALRSWRSADAGTNIQKQALGSIMSCDILLADLTTANPNVMYELGVRHAANRGPTVLMRAGHGTPPFYVGYLQAIVYDPVEDVAQPEALRERLAEVLRAAARRSEGSPLYEFFPALHVELPPELLSDNAQARAYPRRVKQTLAPSRSKSPEQQRTDVEQAEVALRSTGDTSPAAYLDLLRAYRDTSNWDRLISAAETLPPDVADDPQAMQLVALALNRRSASGDQDRAVGLMRRLVDETGGDAETFGILGRIYKERWKTSGDPADLAQAIDGYRRGFALMPTDYYTGFNAVSLLFIRNDPAADAEVAALLPAVKTLLLAQLPPETTDYWALSVAIEIAVIERQWNEVAELLNRTLALRPPEGFRVTHAESLERLGSRLTGPDAEALARVIESLRRGTDEGEDDYA